VVDPLNDLRKYVDSCKKCGFCKAVCPVFRSSGYIETAGPRGRMLLLQGLLEGALKPNNYLSRRLHCTLCGYCSIKCVSGLELTEAYLIGRHYLLSNGVVLPGIKDLISNVVSLGNPYGVGSGIKSMWIDFLEERPAKESKVIYFAGCTTAIRRPESAVAAYSLLKSIVGEVAIVEDEPCCHSPLYLAGDWSRFKEGVLKVIKSIKNAGGSVVVTTCPACTRSLREYARNVGVEHDLSVYHIVEYLRELLNQGRLPNLELEATITYHDPCELGRHMGIVREPRELLNRIRGIKLVEMKASGLESNCCGGGGLYLPLDPEGSMSIAINRLNDLPDGVKYLVTACPSCEVQLSRAVQTVNLDIEVVDISEIVWRSLSRSN